jgi:hypothetical protein
MELDMFRKSTQKPVTATLLPRKALFALSGAMLALAGASASHAASDDWNFGIGTGLSSLALDGDVGFGTESGGVIADMDLDNGDTADMFESAFGFRGFANKGPWTISFGYATLTLEDDDAGLDAEWDRAQAHVEVEYNFAVTGNHRWGVVGGARLTDHEWEFQDKETGEKFKPDDDWTDAVIGLTHMVPIAKNWSWSSRVDYGFGDSEGSFSAKTGVNWKPWEHWVFNGSLAYYSIEYGDEDDIADSDFYYYDVDETVIGLGFAYVW